MIIDAHPNRLVNSAVGNFTARQHISLPLLAKVPNFSVDVKKLQQHMSDVVKTHPQSWVYRDPVSRPLCKYGGWSVTSLTGEVHDGWQSQSGYVDGKAAYDSAAAASSGFRPRWFHTNKTEICTGYLNDVVDMVSDLGFSPVAIRIWDNPPGGTHIGMHTDGPNNMYCVRLHIPIVTNPECIHVWYTKPEQRHHIPADGSAYLFRTNVNHDTFNYGTTERYHLIFEVWDTKGIVPGFKFNDIKSVERDADAWMKEFVK